MKKECRFAAGQREGAKSSFWKVKVDKNEIYLFTSLFGADFKLSIHSPNEVQWSYTSESVKRNFGMKNKERHLLKWNYTRPQDNLAVNIYRIQIPHSELRANNHQFTTKKVKWVSGITLGTYQFDLCITKPFDTNPTLDQTDLPHKVLDCLQLADKRWLVIFYQAAGLTPADIANLKTTIVQEKKQQGVKLDNDCWIAAFGNSDDGVPLILELHHENPIKKTCWARFKEIFKI
jgi:hypothetical protein